MIDAPLNDQLINSVIDLARQAGSKFYRNKLTYEKPANPDIHIKSDELLPDAAAELILNKLIQK